MSEATHREKPSATERALAMILPVVDRLRGAVEAENRELQRRGAIDYQGHSQRKNQGLLELTRLKTALGVVRSHPTACAALADLSAKLDVNQRLLHTQLRAAKTVSGVVARAIREGQSDGTYSAYPWRDEER